MTLLFIFYFLKNDAISSKATIKTIITPASSAATPSDFHIGAWKNNHSNANRVYGNVVDINGYLYIMAGYGDVTVKTTWVADGITKINEAYAGIIYYV